MKQIAVIVLSLLIVACGGTRSTDKLLAEVREKDQSVRQQMVALSKAIATDDSEELIDSLILTCELMDRVDRENMAIVDSLLQSGVPAGLTADSYSTIWIVIDHSTLEKQEQYLPIVEQMASKNLIDASDYVTLCDRVAMERNRPQRYGTQSVQFGTPDSLKLYIYPVEAPDQLDSLRATVGLSPMAEYIELLTTTMGIEARYIPTLTVEGLNHLKDQVTAATE